jgi:hypothetical protein
LFVFYNTNNLFIKKKKKKKKKKTVMLNNNDIQSVQTTDIVVQHSPNKVDHHGRL